MTDITSLLVESPLSAALIILLLIYFGVSKVLYRPVIDSPTYDL